MPSPGVFHRRGLIGPRLILLCLPVILCATAFAAPSGGDPLLWDRRLNFEHPLSPILADIDGDEGQEIIVVGLEGRMVALDGPSGRPLWRTDLPSSPKPIAAAVLAEDRSFDIVVPDDQGYLNWIDGSTGDLIGRVQLGATPNAAPTVWDFDGDGCDEILIVTENPSQLVFIGVVPDEEVLELRSAVSLIANDGKSPAVGDVDGDGDVEVVISDQIGGIRLLDELGRGIAEWSIRQAIATPPMLVDLTGDGRSRIVFADMEGRLWVLGLSESDDGGVRLVPDFSALVGERGAMFRLLSAVSVDSTGSGTVFLTGERTIRAISASTGGELWSDSMPRRPDTTTSVAELGDADALLVFVDAEGAIMLHRSVGGVHEPLPPLGADGRCAHAPLLADLDGDQTLDVFVIKARGNAFSGRALTTGITCAQWEPLWVCAEGSPSNPGHWSAGQTLRLHAQIDAFNERVQRMAVLAQGALSNGETEQARTLAEQVLRWNANHVLANEVIDEVTRPERQRRALFLTVISLAGLTVLALIGVNLRRRRKTRQRLAGARSEGRWGEVLRLLEPAARARPEDRGIRRQLAEAHIALGNFSAETRPLIAELEPSPENRWALAQCALSSGAVDDEALALYREVIESGRGDVPLHRALAQGLLDRGETTAALTHLREVVRLSPDDQSAATQLCEAQVQADELDDSFLNAASLLMRLGRATPTICKALCKAAAMRGKVLAPEVESATQLVLSAEPADPWALLCRGIALSEQQAWDQVTELVATLPEGDVLAPFDLPLRAVAAAHAPGPHADEILTRLSRMIPSPNPRLMVHVAMRLTDSGRRDEVTRSLCELAMASPDCPVGVLEALSECLERADRPEERVQVLERLAHLEPQRPERWRDYGLLCASLGRTDEPAQKAYFEMLEHPPEDSVAMRHLLSACATAEIRDPRISALAERLFAERPNDSRVGLLFIRTLLEQGATTEAHRQASAIAAKIDPSDHQSMALIAQAAFEAKDFESARRLYERLHSAQPESPVWARQLSVCLSRLGVQSAEALALHRRVAKDQPGDPVAQMIYATALLESGDVTEGLGVVRRTLREHAELAPKIIRLLNQMLAKLPPESADPVRFLLADLLSEQGELSEAASHLNALLATSPEDTQALAGKIERMAGEAPDNADAVMALGQLCLQRGDVSRARRVLEKAVQLEMESPDLFALLVECERQAVQASDTPQNRLRLGECCLRAGFADEALSALQPIQDDVFLYRPVRLALAQAYLMKGLVELAQQALKTVPIDEKSRDVFYDVGDQLLSMGQAEAARDVWRQLYASDIGYRDIRTRYEQVVEKIRSGASITQSTADALASVGDQLFRERFELEEEVGVGGMGRVYRARDKTLDETVALKILPPQLASNTSIVERLKREVRAARQLTHPHIIRIHDFGDLGGQKFLSMEFIDGPTLKHVIRTPPGLSLRRALLIAHQMAEALAYAHHQGIVHRDIKPANIMVAADDVIKITDFGIAKVLTREEAEMTSSDQIVGTPLYMSPEQVRGGKIDGRADIYSFGVTLFEMIMGHPPFQEGDLAYHHLSTPAPELEGVSPRIAAIVKGCLRKSPADRWQRFEEILEAFDRLEESDIGEAGDGPP
ncbi:protein kinase [Candidatus Sumerlaeota bacterium]|nr:protein kinase [Candidatus Sumerlaeota bacterium]